jgi:hypothetical protein
MHFSYSCAVDYGFELRSGQTKDYKIGICCFSADHATIRRKSKDWLAQNQDNVSEWGDMSICGLLFQWISTMKIQLNDKKVCIKIIVSEWLFNLFSANSAIFQPYILAKTSLFLMKWWWDPFSWIFIVLIHWNNSPQIDMSPHSDTLSWFWANQSLLFLSQFYWWRKPESQEKTTDMSQATGKLYHIIAKNRKNMCTASQPRFS